MVRKREHQQKQRAFHKNKQFNPNQSTINHNKTNKQIHQQLNQKKQKKRPIKKRLKLLRQKNKSFLNQQNKNINIIKRRDTITRSIIIMHLILIHQVILDHLVILIEKKNIITINILRNQRRKMMQRKRNKQPQLKRKTKQRNLRLKLHPNQPMLKQLRLNQLNPKQLKPKQPPQNLKQLLKLKLLNQLLPLTQCKCQVKTDTRKRFLLVQLHK